MIFFSILIALIAVLALLLTLVVLLQSGKGGGLAGIASGGATRQVLGARQAPDLLERATWTLATLFVVLCIASNFAVDRGEAPESTIQERTGQQPVPGGPGQSGQGQPQGQPQGQSGQGQQAPPSGGEQEGQTPLQEVPESGGSGSPQGGNGRGGSR